MQGTASAEALSAQQAEGLRHILTDLGPAFVKIGQVKPRCSLGKLLAASFAGRSGPFRQRQHSPSSSIRLLPSHPLNAALPVKAWGFVGLACKPAGPCPDVYPIPCEHGSRLSIKSVALQAVSSRPDVIPPGFLAELEKLQDQIPPFPDEDAYAVISAELGVPASAVFSSLTPSPIAAASLGQARSSSWPICSMWVARPCRQVLITEGGFRTGTHIQRLYSCDCNSPAFVSIQHRHAHRYCVKVQKWQKRTTFSCGQVYKGTLRSSGQAVAVKVQRPGVREQIAMDVFILRNLLAFVREWRKVNRRVTAVVSGHGS